MVQFTNTTNANLVTVAPTDPAFVSKRLGAPSARSKYKSAQVGVLVKALIEALGCEADDVAELTIRPGVVEVTEFSKVDGNLALTLNQEVHKTKHRVKYRWPTSQPSNAVITKGDILNNPITVGDIPFGKAEAPILEAAKKENRPGRPKAPKRNGWDESTHTFTVGFPPVPATAEVETPALVPSRRRRFQTNTGAGV